MYVEGYVGRQGMLVQRSKKCRSLIALVLASLWHYDLPSRGVYSLHSATRCATGSLERPQPEPPENESGLQGEQGLRCAHHFLQSC